MKCLKHKPEQKTISNTIGSVGETEKTFNFISKCLRISGIYISPEEVKVPKKLKYLRIFYSSCITFVIAFHAIRLLWLKDREATLEDYLPQFIAYAFSQFHILAINITHVWRFNKKLPQLKQKFRDYEIRYGLSTGSVRMFGLVRPASVSCFVFSIALLTALTASAGYIPGFQNILVPFDTTSGWVFWSINATINILTLPGLIQYGVLTVLFIVLCSSLVKEFEKVTQMLWKGGDAGSERLSTDGDLDPLTISGDENIPKAYYQNIDGLESSRKTCSRIERPLTSSEDENIPQAYCQNIKQNDNTVAQSFRQNVNTGTQSKMPLTDGQRYAHVQMQLPNFNCKNRQKVKNNNVHPKVSPTNLTDGRNSEYTVETCAQVQRQLPSTQYENIPKDIVKINKVHQVNSPINAGENRIILKEPNDQQTIENDWSNAGTEGSNPESTSGKIAKERELLVNRSGNLNPRIRPTSNPRFTTSRSHQMHLKRRKQVQLRGNSNRCKLSTKTKGCTVYNKGLEKNQIVSEKCEDYPDQENVKDAAENKMWKISEQSFLGHHTSKEFLKTLPEDHHCQIENYQDETKSQTDLHKIQDRFPNNRKQMGEQTLHSVIQSHRQVDIPQLDMQSKRISHPVIKKTESQPEMFKTPDRFPNNRIQISEKTLQPVIQKTTSRTEVHKTPDCCPENKKRIDEKTLQPVIQKTTSQTEMLKTPDCCLENKKRINEKTLHRVIQQHTAICELVSELNKVFECYLLVVIAFLVPSLCFLAVAITNASAIPRENLISNIVFTSASGSYGIILILIPSILNSVAHEPLEVLVDLDVAHFTTAGYRKYGVFVTKLRSLKIGISLYGFVVIQKSTILTILGTLLTYLIVIIQFKPDGTGQKCVDLLQNLNYTR